MRGRGLLVAAVTLALALPAAPAAAAVLTVTDLGDAPDPTPTDATCDAPCSLRGALQTANRGSPGLDEILVPAGRIELADGAADGADPAATGDLDLTEDVRVSGAGRDATTIDANGLHRIFDVAAGVTATIQAMTVTGGRAPFDASFSSSVGGGIRAMGTTTVNDVRVTDNNAVTGGGIASDDPLGSLTLNRVLVDSNSGYRPPDWVGIGGGVAERNGGTLTINESVVRGNVAASGAGVCECAGGTVVVDRTLVEGNGPPPGVNSIAGGLYETGGGTLTITASTVRGNQAQEGGGIDDSGGGTINIVDTEVVDNRATGGAFASGGGLLEEAGGTINISGSTFAGNSAAKFGGGLALISDGKTTITNSTLTGNTAQLGGGAVATRGAPVIVGLRNVTLAANSSVQRGGSIDTCQDQHPPCTSDTELSLQSSIVAGSCLGPITSLGANVGADATCALTGDGDQPGVDPLLGELAANGGPTRTIAELDGSPAIDRGAGCPPVDQRGVARPQGEACDAGAFERAKPAPPLAEPPPPAGGDPRRRRRHR